MFLICFLIIYFCFQCPMSFWSSDIFEKLCVCVFYFISYSFSICDSFFEDFGVPKPSISVPDLQFSVPWTSRRRLWAPWVAPGVPRTGQDAKRYHFRSPKGPLWSPLAPFFVPLRLGSPLAPSGSLFVPFWFNVGPLWLPSSSSLAPCGCS